MQSLTYRGIAVLVLSWFFAQAGIPILEGKLETAIEVAILIPGVVWAVYGRYRAGGITIFGKRKDPGQPPVTPPLSEE